MIERERKREEGGGRERGGMEGEGGRGEGKRGNGGGGREGERERERGGRERERGKKERERKLCLTQCYLADWNNLDRECVFVVVYVSMCIM